GQLRAHGVPVFSGGGETADVGDLARTILVDTCAVTTLNRKSVIAKGIHPGLSIVGLSSTGRASYEGIENSGIGSNGLTSARHDLLCEHYRENYPEAYDPDVDLRLIYCGPFRLEDSLPDSPLSVGQALLSPTRSYAPVLLKIYEEALELISAVIHCSGGGQTKCLRFSDGNTRIVKDHLFKTPPIFSAIQQHSRTDWREMYQVYNMGHRMEVYCQPEAVDLVIRAAAAFDIEAQVIGNTRPAGREGAGLTIESPHGVFDYPLG
ncbi:MAG: phosphoribosylformylglycinamidine cyclo-ligase, partial [Planctomycetes bacterium]|nr:phosphoribosylformylglycinamidine cyclo-ligase [Planctomycetota bacterium]